MPQLQTGETSRPERIDEKATRLAQCAADSLLEIPEVRSVTIVIDWHIEGDLPNGWWRPRAGEAGPSELLSMLHALTGYLRQMGAVLGQMFTQLVSKKPEQERIPK
jgi:hypothetical protein